MKTKLGISVGLLGAITYFAALFGGWLPVLLITGYVLLCETNIWLRKTTLNVLALMGIFALADLAISVVPNALLMLEELVDSFDGFISITDFFTHFENFLLLLLALIKQAFFVILAFLALGQRGINIPPITNFINKHSPIDD